MFFCFICINECSPDNDDISNEDEAVYSSISLIIVHYVIDCSVSFVSECRVILPCNRGYVVLQFDCTVFQ